MFLGEKVVSIELNDAFVALAFLKAAFYFNKFKQYNKQFTVGDQTPRDETKPPYLVQPEYYFNTNYKKRNVGDRFLCNRM